MIIRKYGIILRRLTAEDIELVRVHRNSDEIRRHMFYQETITPEMQKKWFATTKTIYDHYFIVEYKNKKIGMLFCKNDNYEERTTEAGFFIWDKEFRNTHVPVFASLIFAELGFIFREMKKTYAIIRKENKQAITYAEQLGYVLHKEIPEENKLIYLLTKEDFKLKAAKIRKAVARVTGDYTELSDVDFDLSGISPEERKQFYSAYPPYLQQKFDRVFDKNKK